ncbi:MAG: endolytic transglycosylase MltG [Oscillospiraceae bacterium]|nr:endolytic transglycosylase MltG [Oscillospiraceae bacterium]
MNENELNQILNPDDNEKDTSNEELFEIIKNAKDKVDNQKKANMSENQQKKNVSSNSKKKRKRKKKRNTGKIAFRLIIFCVIIIIACICAFFLINIGMEVTGLGRHDDTELTIEIPKGATSEDIANILVDNEIINNPIVFRVLSNKQNANSYKAGKHKVTANMSYSDLIDVLQQDPIQEKISVDVTFPEGYTLDQCAAELEKAGVCRADEFIEAFNSAEFGYNFEKKVEDKETKYYKMEGYCFPDTYTFFKDSEPEVVCKKIYANFAEKVNANMLGRMEDLGLTLDETLALASIVQSEAPTSNQMKLVSSVFWNRLNDKETFPRLESDPTKKYAALSGIELYDTYKSEGVPPGAICNPGADAINAVLYPEETEYYFFCSNLTTQEFYYAKTLKQHEKNLAEAGLI